MRPDDGQTTREIGSRPRRRAALVGLLALVVLSGIYEERTTGLSILTLVHFSVANLLAGTTGDLAFMWSIETFNQTLSLEGPFGESTLTAVRVTSPDGEAVVASALSQLDPAKNVGVCPEHRPPLGTPWWRGQVPAAMANDLRTTGNTAYRIEVLAGSTWRRVMLIDSGCRGVGRF
ncbi:MAG: hypothetical protein KGK34_01535 [Chloroflexota bacterium]|nr:hypothetical protein [Chloroflexota bacterium]